MLQKSLLIWLDSIYTLHNLCTKLGKTEIVEGVIIIIFYRRWFGSTKNIWI